MNMIDFSNLKVDKKNGDTSYNDEFHKYWNSEDLIPSISVTTLIGQFDPFDVDFWSKYKTLEIIMGDDFKIVKPDLLKFKKFDDTILEEYEISNEEFQSKLNELLQEWDDKREKACARGTHLHKEYELKLLKKIIPILNYMIYLIF